MAKKKPKIEMSFEDFRSSPLRHVKKIYQKFNIEGYLNNEDSFKKYIDNFIGGICPTVDFKSSKLNIFHFQHLT